MIGSRRLNIASCLLLAGSLVMGLVGFTGCGSSEKTMAKANDMIDEVIAHQKEFGMAMAKVVDETTAREQLPTMEKAYNNMLAKIKELEKTGRKAVVLGQIDKENLDTIDRRVVDARKEADTRDRPHYVRVKNNPSIMAVLGPLFQKIEDGPLN